MSIYLILLISIKSDEIIVNYSSKGAKHCKLDEELLDEELLDINLDVAHLRTRLNGGTSSQPAESSNPSIFGYSSSSVGGSRAKQIAGDEVFAPKLQQQFEQEQFKREEQALRDEELCHSIKKAQQNNHDYFGGSGLASEEPIEFSFSPPPAKQPAESKLSELKFKDEGTPEDSFGDDVYRNLDLSQADAYWKHKANGTSQICRHLFCCFFS